MSESTLHRSAVIRGYLSAALPDADTRLITRYGSIAARWEALRLLLDAGDGTASDGARYNDLTALLRGVSEALGLPVCTDEDRGPDGVPGVTWTNGYLPHDPERIVSPTWREAAAGW